MVGNLGSGGVADRNYREERKKMKMFRVTADGERWCGNFRHKEAAERVAEIWKTIWSGVKVVEVETGREW